MSAEPGRPIDPYLVAAFDTAHAGHDVRDLPVLETDPPPRQEGPIPSAPPPEEVTP